jgi:hypothetical protein
MVALIALSPCRLASVWVAAKKLRANPFLRLSNSAEGGDVADVVRQVLRPDERLKSPQAAVALLSHEATDHPTAHQHALGQTPRRKWLLKRCRPAPGDGLVEKARKRRRIRCSDQPDEHDHASGFVLTEADAIPSAIKSDFVSVDIALRESGFYATQAAARLQSGLAGFREIGGRDRKARFFI